jgi:copper transport protein
VNKTFRWLIAAMMLLACFSMTQPVFAHAELVSSTPEANARLGRAPAQIALLFSEEIDPNFSRIRVLNTQGTQVDNGDTKVDPAEQTRLTVSLRSLPDGVYTVAWRVVSADDGHLTEGSFPFAVGNIDTAALAAAQNSAGSQAATSPGSIVVRALLYLAIAVLAGGLLFAQLVWRTSLAAIGVEGGDTPRFTTMQRQMAVGALALVGLASLLGVMAQAGEATGSGIAWPWSAAALSVWVNSRYGLLVIARLAAGLALAGLVLAPANRRNRWAALPLLVGLALTYSLTSHAAAQPAPLLPVASDTLHLLAASVWVGGLFLFVAGLRLSGRLDPSPRTRLVAALIPHFSTLALASVGILTLTGVYAALVDVGSLDLLISTSYGQALLIKLALALPMVGMGAYNLLVTTPRMRRAAQAVDGDAGRVAFFRKLVTTEASLGLALIVWVGVFTALPPAKVNAAPAGFQQMLSADDLTIQLSIDPGRVGLNTFKLTLTSGGKPVVDASEVDLRFTAQSGSIATEEARLVNVGEGKYSLKGSYLSLADQWQVTAIVRRPTRYDAYASVIIDTAAAGGTSGSTAPRSIPLNQLAAILLAVTTLAYAFAFFSLVPRRLVWIVLGQAPALLLLLASLLTFNQTVQADLNDPPNPVTPGASSIQAGQALYQANCLACHGPQGRGDGPIGLTLNPRPADLTQHAVPGVHTDGQLFLWISNGYPNSVMPGFSDKLSETDRWNLVNYMRTLAPKN